MLRRRRTARTRRTRFAGRAADALLRARSPPDAATTPANPSTTARLPPRTARETARSPGAIPELAPESARTANAVDRPAESRRSDGTLHRTTGPFATARPRVAPRRNPVRNPFALRGALEARRAGERSDPVRR